MSLRVTSGRGGAEGGELAATVLAGLGFLLGIFGWAAVLVPAVFVGFGLMVLAALFTPPRGGRR